MYPIDESYLSQAPKRMPKKEHFRWRRLQRGCSSAGMRAQDTFKKQLQRKPKIWLDLFQQLMKDREAQQMLLISTVIHIFNKMKNWPVGENH